MTAVNPTTPARFAPWAASWKATITLILGVTTFRILYLAFLCPYTLIEDETNYWEWARHLSLSYYTKGPGIAWTIAAFIRVFGESAFAIRLVAVTASALTAWFIVGLAHDITRDKRTAFFAAAIFFLTPVFQALGLLSTIDGPYAACSAAACWAAYRALHHRSPTALLSLGLALGIGTLYKYTMLLFLPGLIAYAWIYRGSLFSSASSSSSEISNLKFQICSLLSLLLFLSLSSPILIWNAQHHWPTIHHLLGHLALPGGDKEVTQAVHGWHYNPTWTLSFLGIQLAIAGPMLIPAFLQVRRLWNNRAANPSRWHAAAFLLSQSLPLLFFYTLVSFATQPQGNWALAAFPPLTILSAWGAVELFEQARATNSAPSLLLRHSWNLTTFGCLILGLFLLRLDVFRYLPVVGPKIPLWRFMDADKMALHTRRLGDELKAETGHEPFFLALHYGRASQLAFYMKDRPTVFCSSSFMLGGRTTPYDFWPDTNLRTRGTVVPLRRLGPVPTDDGPLFEPTSRDPNSLLGRDAIVVGATRQDWEPLFDRVTLVGTLDGDGKKGRPAFKCYNFHGFPPGGLRTPDAPETFGP